MSTTNSALLEMPAATPVAAPATPREKTTAARAAVAISRHRRAEESTREASILLVDDEEFNLLVFNKYLRAAGYFNVRQVTDSSKAIDIIYRDPPDLLLLDLIMPKVTGLDILAALMSDPRFEQLPVLILTASCDAEIKQAALDMGATDFLIKPVVQQDLLPRVRNALLNKLYRDKLSRYAHDLEDKVSERTRELSESRREVVMCLARAAEFRDMNTGHHVTRVGRYVGVIARELGFSGEYVELLELATQLHDIGKLGVPDEILNKPGKLDPAEYDVIKKHCHMGEYIMAPMADAEHRRLQQQASPAGSVPTSTQRIPLLALASSIAASHHEHWNGAGYPRGLQGEQIPIEGRMTAVADVFDALSSERPYKKAFPIEQCLDIIRASAGTQFDPKVVDAFLRRLPEILALQHELRG